MKKIRFFTKPNCINSRKQLQLLAQHPVQVEEVNLLEHPWARASLRQYFQGLPKEKWLNSSAPAVKSGEVIASNFTADQLLERMIVEPLLIRRPLIEWQDSHWVGFDWDHLCSQLGLDGEVLEEDVETCARVQRADAKQG